MKKINQMKSREAMGYPESYKDLHVECNSKSFHKLRFLDADELVTIIEDPKQKFSDRWAAGNILALIGDPRLDPFNPKMCVISAAEVTLGSTQDEINQQYELYKDFGVKKQWLQKEYPVHIEFLNSYLLAKYPVTNYEYLKFLKENSQVKLPASWTFGRYDESKSNHPVYGVKINDAKHYAKWLSAKTQRKFSLPTECEWEYAAAGPERREYPWGNHFSSDYANTVELGLLSSSPVGLFPQGQSIFGCHDMSGNVEEYVSNHYFPYPRGHYIHDDLNRRGKYYVARGGSFTRYADLARTRRRHGYFNKPIYVVGFRLKEEI